MTHDAEAKVYEIHPGIGTNIAGIVGLPAGPSLHFVLNNQVYGDNRIPPRGFTNAAFAAFGGAPVGHSYADGQYWDHTEYTVPVGTRRAEVRLYYQSTSKEFVEFLRDANTTNTKGQELYDLWTTNGKCPPTTMAQLTVVSTPPTFAGLQTATPAVESATLTWNTASSACPVTYRVYVAPNSGGQNFSSPVLTTNTLSAVVAPLYPGSNNWLRYYFVVRAGDACGGSESNTVELSLQPLLNPAGDQDSDGMPNSYEQTHNLNPFHAADAGQDKDGDGFTNLEESIAGTSAVDANDAPKIKEIVSAGDGIHIRFPTVSGRRYQVRWRADLTTGDWENLGSHVDGDGTAKEVIDTPGLGVTKRFYQVLITQP